MSVHNRQESLKTRGILNAKDRENTCALVPFGCRSSLGANRQQFDTCANFRSLAQVERGAKMAANPLPELIRGDLGRSAQVKAPM
jgi:hypothetical protein